MKWRLALCITCVDICAAINQADALINFPFSCTAVERRVWLCIHKPIVKPIKQADIGTSVITTWHLWTVRKTRLVSDTDPKMTWSASLTWSAKCFRFW